MAVLNDLDHKLLEHFRGYVVKKDLVRMVKVGANVRYLYWNIWLLILALLMMKKKLK